MDVLCEQSLFRKGRRVGNGQVHVYPYKKNLHCPLEYEGVKLVELHWDVDESTISNSIAVVDEPQKLEDVQNPVIEGATLLTEQFGEEVESFSYETDTDESVAEEKESSCIYEDEQSAKTSPVNSLPEGIGKAHRRGDKTRRYKCLYCPQIGLIPGRRTMKSAMFHRAHCNHNPHRDRHYEEYRSKTSSRKISCPQVPSSAGKSNSLIKCWVVVDGNKYACRECVDNGEELKIWKCRTSVKTHCVMKCKYRNTSTNAKPSIIDSNESSDNAICTDRSKEDAIESKRTTLTLMNREFKRWNRKE